MSRSMLPFLSVVSVLGSALAASHGGHMHEPKPVTYSGFLLDWACFNRTLDGLGAPDGSNVIAGPSAHYTGCLLLEGANAPAQCKAGGYYLGQQCGGPDNYHPKFDLSADPVSHANAVAFLEGIHDPVARPTDIKVTVTGLNDHGKIINATFTQCTGDNCDGVCVGDEHACEGLNDDECTENTVTYSGYIIDWNCWNLVGMGQPTPDGSDIVAAPWDHSTGCLVGPAACRTGYYLAMKDGDGNYHPYLSLNHSTSHDMVLAWLDAMHAANAKTDVAVTVSGVSHMGNLMHAKISECTNRGAAGSVTDGVFMGARGCDGTCTGNCACNLMDQSGCVTTTTTTMQELQTVTYSGFLLDWACFNRTLDGLGAPDGSNVIAGPSAHYTGCLLLEGANAPAQCKAGGYYLGQQCGGPDNYHPKFDLSADPVSHANAVAFLEGIHDPVARPTDIKVTVTGLNDHGRIINATFTQCTGDSCDGVCVGDEHACEGLNDDECTENTVTYSGYIIDWNCWNLVGMGQPTPDGSDIVAAPWDHSTGCLVGPPACRTGYYLAMKDGDGNYHPYLSLNHSTSHDTVLAWLDAMHAANAKTDVAVTVSGVSHMGNLMHAKISECTNRGAAGSVTDGVFMGARGCDGTCTGNCACNLMDQSGCVTDDTSGTVTTTGSSVSTTESDDSSSSDSSTTTIESDDSISLGSAAAFPSVAALLLSLAAFSQ